MHNTESPSKKKTMLIIDDDEFVLESCHRIFIDEGYESDYLQTVWVSHQTEGYCHPLMLPTLYPSPVVTKLAGLIDKITDEVYYKSGDDIPLVICKQFPDVGFAFKAFVVL